MSSLAKARTGTARAARCAPAAERAVSLIKILLQTVARVSMFPFPSLLAGQPSGPGTGGGECLRLNAARVFLSNQTISTAHDAGVYPPRPARFPQTISAHDAFAVRFQTISTARSFAERDGGLSRT